jgi:hypothetical protein
MVSPKQHVGICQSAKINAQLGRGLRNWKRSAARGDFSGDAASEAEPLHFTHSKVKMRRDAGLG